MVPAVSRESAATFPLVRFPNPRRADARRSGLACIRTPQESPFLRRPDAVHPGAAGVSQPWFLETSSQWLDRNCRAEASGRWCVHEHRCNCVTIPRRADARRSWLSIWQLPNNARFLRYSVRIVYPRRADARRSGLSVWQLPNNARFLRYSVRIAYPRRADARRSWLSIWQLPNNARFLRYSVGIAYPRRADACGSGLTTASPFRVAQFAANAKNV
jgi:hypothetical protein